MNKEQKIIDFYQKGNSQNKCAKLWIAKNGFVKTEKRGGKQVIKNCCYFKMNETMKPITSVFII